VETDDLVEEGAGDRDNRVGVAEGMKCAAFKRRSNTVRMTVLLLTRDKPLMKSIASLLQIKFGIDRG
jgi:hypothetical protein